MGGKVRVITGALVAISVVTAVAFATRFGKDPSLAPSPLIGQAVPDLYLPGLRADDDLTLKSMLGKIVVVNFYASWCIQCRNEHADLVSTAEAYAARNVVFVQIAYQDDPDDTVAFLDELGWSEHTRYVTDPASRAAIAFGLRGVPETFFIAEDGTVVAAIRGESDAILLSGTLESILAGDRPGFRRGGEFQESR